MTTDAELDYLEKLFDDDCRKEIDQEENVWRTLPFFTATLALQLAGVAQVRNWVGGVPGALYWLSLTLLGAAALATFAALLFLAESIWLGRCRYATREPDLKNYIKQVRAAEIAGGTTDAEATLVAFSAARAVMVQQYTLGAAHN